MKAIVVHEYGGPEVLKFEEYPDPVPGAGDVLVRAAATSVNPIDYKRRARVEGFRSGDLVFAVAADTYAELCVVKATSLAKLPGGLNLIDAAASPLVTTTGNQLISEGTAIKAGQTMFVAGAAGSVGRSAVFTAKDRGAFVIAGVLKRQTSDAASIGADQVIATDDESAIDSLPLLEAVADAVDGQTAEKIISKVKPGGVFASVLGPPQNAGNHPSVKVVPVFATANFEVLQVMAEAVREGKLSTPISRRFQLSDAGEAQVAAEKGASGKVLLLA